ncbi:MAG: SMC family ATPase [Chloroflexi bacterium]|nr:SMC family ATPase [Chloroflexota bacterium]
MIPVYLKISGFLSYQQPVELQFDGFDLACISGSNGAGKSSLLDAITWVLFGQARKRDDSVINSHSDGAEVVLDFRYEGETYRVQRSKVIDKPTMLDFFILDKNDRWRTLSEHTMRETEKRIEQILRMDYDTFTNASFFLQGKADQFAQQRPGDRKRILSNILGLDSWETYREMAIQRRRQQEMELNILNSRLDEVESELAEETERKSRLESLQNEMKQVTALRTARQEVVDQLRKLANSLTEQEKMVRILHDQLDASVQRKSERSELLNQRRLEHGRYQEQIAAAPQIEAAYQEWQNSRQELENWEKIAVNFREFQELRNKPYTALQIERSRITQEIKVLSEAQNRISILDAELAEIIEKRAQLAEEIIQTKSILEGRSVLENDLNEIKQTAADSAAENKRMRLEMQDLKERIDQLKETEGAACPLCGQPLSPDDRLRLIESLENEGKSLGDRFRANQDFSQKAELRIKEIEKQLAENKKYDTVLLQQQRQSDQMEDQIRQRVDAINEWQQSGELRLAELNTMLAEESFATDIRQELAAMDDQLKAIGYDSARHESIRQQEAGLRSSEEQKRQLERARATLEPLEREILDIQKGITILDGEISRQEQEFLTASEKYQKDAEGLPNVQKAESELMTLQEQENRLRTEVGGARQRVTVLNDQRKRKTEMHKKREGINRQIGQLKTLERAFGKDGVPALLIEQALPEIEVQANLILDRLTAGGMSVRFETQQDYKDKKRDDKRETLDILISDSAGMRDYALFSGGEAFRVNFAIRLALSRVLAQRAGARLQTLVIDEGFGSQDAEGRQRLIEAINMVRPDFEKILVITHLEELKDAFPARIEVEKTPTGSQVTVVL